MHSIFRILNLFSFIFLSFFHACVSSFFEIFQQQQLHFPRKNKVPCSNHNKNIKRIHVHHTVKRKCSALCRLIHLFIHFSVPGRQLLMLYFCQLQLLIIVCKFIIILHILDCIDFVVCYVN